MEKIMEKVFSPIKINNMYLKNRMVMAPMHTKFASEHGEVTDRLERYIEERAKGGVALIILENTCIDWLYGRAAGNPVTIHDDLNRNGLSNIALAAHRHGVKIVTQLHHTGRQNLKSNIGERTHLQPVAPSAVKSKIGGSDPRELKEDEIEEIIQMYVDAARRTREAGFDGVELHGAHGYLLTQFFSPYTNRREDKWGGSLKNRARFPMEVVKRIRFEVGDDFPVLYRLSAEERIEGGTTLEDTLKLVKMLDRAGVDCFDVTAGIYDSVEWIYTLQGVKPGSLIPLASAVKNVTEKPVIGVSRLGWEPKIAAEFLNDDKIDMIAIGRSLLSDPELPEKVRTGRENEIRRCLACNECVAFQNMGRQLRCCINPELGNEYRNLITVDDKKKKVTIIGAGPGGLECALTSARRGHEVTVLEKEGTIGGQLIAASAPAFKNEEFSALIDYYSVMIKKYKIKLKLNFIVNETTKECLDADVIVLATGAVPETGKIDGSNHIMPATEVLKSGKRNMKEAVIIGGSGVGIDTALFLTENKEAKVTIIEMNDSIGGDLNEFLKRHSEHLMKDRNIVFLTNTKVTGVEKDGVLIRTDLGSGKISSKNIISAVGFKGNPCLELKKLFEDKGKRVITLPSAEDPGRLFETTQSGFWKALEI